MRGAGSEEGDSLRGVRRAKSNEAEVRGGRIGQAELGAFPKQLRQRLCTGEWHSPTRAGEDSPAVAFQAKRTRNQTGQVFRRRFQKGSWAPGMTASHTVGPAPGSASGHTLGPARALSALLCKAWNCS